MRLVVVVLGSLMLAAIIGYCVGVSKMEGEFAHRCVDAAVENGWIKGGE